MHAILDHRNKYDYILAFRDSIKQKFLFPPKGNCKELINYNYNLNTLKNQKKHDRIDDYTKKDDNNEDEELLQKKSLCLTITWVI